MAVTTYGSGYKTNLGVFNNVVQREMILNSSQKSMTIPATELCILQLIRASRFHYASFYLELSLLRKLLYKIKNNKNNVFHLLYVIIIYYPRSNNEVTSAHRLLPAIVNYVMLVQIQQRKQIFFQKRTPFNQSQTIMHLQYICYIWKSILFLLTLAVMEAY